MDEQGDKEWRCRKCGTLLGVERKGVVRQPPPSRLRKRPSRYAVDRELCPGEQAHS